MVGGFWEQRTETLFRANTYGLTDYPFALHVTPARLYMLSLWLMIPKSTLKQQSEGGERVYAITSVSNYAITLCGLPVSD